MMIQLQMIPRGRRRRKVQKRGVLQRGAEECGLSSGGNIGHCDRNMRAVII